MRASWQLCERSGYWEGRRGWWWRLSRFPLGACFEVGLLVCLASGRRRQSELLMVVVRMERNLEANVEYLS